MKIHFKIDGNLVRGIRTDLRRPHAYAGERVGFISCRFGTSRRGLLILAHDYLSLADERYEIDASVGARFDSTAMRAALQMAISNSVGVFHVHLHERYGFPRPSPVDSTEWAKFVPDFWHVQPALPHGALIFSKDSMIGFCWYPGNHEPVKIDRFTTVDHRLVSWQVT